MFPGYINKTTSFFQGMAENNRSAIELMEEATKNFPDIMQEKNI